MATVVMNIKDQRRRWPNDRYIGRPSRWGNPFKIGRDGTREEVIAKYAQYVWEDAEMLRAIKAQLRDKTLMCYCAPLPCHGDVLAAIANDEDTVEWWAQYGVDASEYAKATP